MIYIKNTKLLQEILILMKVIGIINLQIFKYILQVQESIYLKKALYHLLLILVVMQYGMKKLNKVLNNKLFLNILKLKKYNYDVRTISNCY